MKYTSNLNNTKEYRRKQIKSLQDEFCTFSWGEADAFEKYGAFIINDKKGSLKFYNGPGFTNEYSKPQFSQHSGDLLGVNFNRSTIDFTVGIYWFTIEEYREFINWLNPLKIDVLSFGFNEKFGYVVKLAKLGDSVKHPIGKDEKGNTTYYTELKLTFEIQGDQVARGLHPYELQHIETKYTANSATSSFCFKTTDSKSFVKSDLPMPVIFNIPLTFTSNSQKELKLRATYQKTILENGGNKTETETIDLFNIIFSNSLVKDVNSNNNTINIKYNSATGMLFLQYGGSNDRVLSLTTTTDTGDRIVQTFKAEKFLIPGALDYNSFNIDNLTFEIETKHLEIKKTKQDKPLVVCECFPRTNIL